MLHKLGTGTAQSEWGSRVCFRVPNYEVEKWCILKMKMAILMKALGLNIDFVSEVRESRWSIMYTLIGTWATREAEVGRSGPKHTLLCLHANCRTHHIRLPSNLAFYSFTIIFASHGALICVAEAVSVNIGIEWLRKPGWSGHGKVKGGKRGHRKGSGAGTGIGVTWGGGCRVGANVPTPLFFCLSIVFLATELKRNK